MRSDATTTRCLLAAAGLVALLIAGPPVAEGAKQVESQAVEQITIDGDASDWNGVPALHLDKSLPMIAVAHDDSNLYLMYRFDDTGLARQLSYHGLILWLNGDSKTKIKYEEFGLRYGGSQQVEQHLEADGDYAEDATSAEPATGPGRHQRAERRPPERNLRHRPRPGELTRIRMGIKKIMPESSDTGLAAASAVHGDVFCYELRIPLAEIGGKVATRPASKTRKLALGIQIAGLTEAERMIIQGQVEEDDMPAPPPSTPGAFGVGHVPIRETPFKAKIEWLKISLPPR